ncbi:MAG: phage head morphogenesis protein [Armatimonadetes bacterium]|nr:phage head morphogenesis protein [Armatimonadota bacterium]
MAITSWEELRKIMEGKRNAPLIAGINVSVTSAIRLGALEALDPKKFPLAQIKAREDACPFCRAMHNKVLRIDQHHAYLPPFHINCRCVVVRLSEGAAPVDFDPEDEEIKRNLHHAHFVADLVKGRQVRYEALRVPARVEGRDFIFRRFKDKATGRWLSKLEFRQGKPTWLKFEGFENLLPEKGQEPVFDLQRIGRAIRQLRQAYPELFHRADLRRVVIRPRLPKPYETERGFTRPPSGIVWLGATEISQRKLPLGNITATDQFLLTLVEELLHPKARTYKINHTKRWSRKRDSLMGRDWLLPILYKDLSLEQQREILKDFEDWVCKGIAALLVGQSRLINDEVEHILRSLWGELK